jgi:hypothetical protein
MCGTASAVRSVNHGGLTFGRIGRLAKRPARSPRQANRHAELQADPDDTLMGGGSADWFVIDGLPTDLQRITRDETTAPQTDAVIQWGDTTVRLGGAPWRICRRTGSWSSNEPFGTLSHSYSRQFRVFTQSQDGSMVVT